MRPLPIAPQHYPQRCGLIHILADEDVVQVVPKKKPTNDGALRGRFKQSSDKTRPDKLSDRVKKAPLKT